MTPNRSRKCRPGETAPADAPTETQWSEFEVERYKFILQQLHFTNENVHRFLAIYQTLATSLAAAGVALFTGYQKLGLTAEDARSALVAIMTLISMVAAYTILQVLVGVASWFDYRLEECELTDKTVRDGFRARPNWRNLYRWYETYTVLFILGTIVALWIFATTEILPRID
ncbi:hypothetical protein ACGF5H_01430 [Micromonospora chalcea]